MTVYTTSSSTASNWAIYSTASTTTTTNIQPGSNFRWVQAAPVNPNTPPTPPRAFNKYINASDLLEDFIKYVGGRGIKQSEVLDLPINLFIHWLIIRAAEQDGDKIPDGILEPEKHDAWKQKSAIPRCHSCGKFINRDRANAGVHFCNEQHLLIFINKSKTKNLALPTK